MGVRDAGPVARMVRRGLLLGLLLFAVVGLALPGSVWAATPAFTDVHDGAPYSAAITELAASGVFSGFSDGSFRPDAPVTRQQFAKVIVKAMGLPVTGNESCPFGDVAGQLGADPFYPSRYVAVCAASGITTGKTATTFAPGDNITREQLISMVARAAGLTVPPAVYLPGFSAGQFSLEEHYLNARQAAYSWLLHGISSLGATHDFLAPASRGECAQILYNLGREGLPAGAELLVADDFTTKWAGRLEEDNGTNKWAYDLVHGTYTCSIFTARLQCRQAQAEEYADFTVEMDARSASAAQGGYGLVVGITPGWDEFYEFIVSNAGYWQLWRKLGSEWEPVTDDRDNVSSAIAWGSVWNHLAVTAVHGRLSVSVNGQQLFVLSGATVSPGRIALLAESSALGGPVTVEFDNYRVWSSPEGAPGG